MIAVNEQGYRVGESHHRAILSDHEVDLMRELRENHGKSYDWLAECFEVHKGTVQDICTYRTRAQTPNGYRVAKPKKEPA